MALSKREWLINISLCVCAAVILCGVTNSETPGLLFILYLMAAVLGVAALQVQMNNVLSFLEGFKEK